MMQHSLDHDLYSLLPGRVLVAFTKVAAGVPVREQYVVTVTLDYTRIPGLPIDFAGSQDAKIFHSTAVANFTLATDTTPTNNAEILAMADQLAYDWWTWQLGRHDMVLSCLAPYAHEGHSDICWSDNEGGISTRVMRQTWNDYTNRVYQYSTAGEIIICCGGDIVVYNGSVYVFIGGVYVLVGGGTFNLTIQDDGTPQVVLTNRNLIEFDETYFGVSAKAPAGAAVTLKTSMTQTGDICEGRLTPNEFDPIPVDPVTNPGVGIDALYDIPFIGNKVKLYNTTLNDWEVHEYDASGVTLLLAPLSLSANTLYNVYLYDNAGVLTLEVSTTGYALVDGIRVKSGENHKRFRGRIRTDASGGYEVSSQRWMLENDCNRRPRAIWVGDNSIHTYGGSSWQVWNNGVTPTANSRVEWISLRDESISVHLNGCIDGNSLMTGVAATLGYGVNDSATATWCQIGHAGTNLHYGSTGGETPIDTLVDGLNYIQVMENGGGLPSGQEASFEDFKMFVRIQS